MEVLPRDEWTSRNSNELALAERVQQLSYMRQLSVAYTTPGMLGNMQRQMKAQQARERHEERAKQLEMMKLTGSDEATMRKTAVSFAEKENSLGEQDEINANNNVHVEEDFARASISPAANVGVSNDNGTVDKAAMVAAKILQRCNEPEEVNSLLEILESEPRNQWATLLARRQY